MATNAERFNGKDSLVTKSAWKIVDTIKRNLNHEKNHFGTERDTIRILEDAIRKRLVVKLKCLFVKILISFLCFYF